MELVMPIFCNLLFYLVLLIVLLNLHSSFTVEMEYCRIPRSEFENLDNHWMAVPRKL